MENLKDYMYQNDLSEEDVLRTLKNTNGFIDKNNFYYEFDNNRAYIETVGKVKMRITNINLEVGFIELEAVEE